MISGEEVNSSYLVFLNGLIIGIHCRPNDLVEKVRTLVLVLTEALYSPVCLLFY